MQQEVFKIRVGNSDAGKGRSGGYRIIYQVHDETAIVLITIDSKSEPGDHVAAEIRKIIAAQEAGADEEIEQGDGEQ